MGAGRAAGWAALTLVVWAASARAQPTHYQAILVGDRSSGLGTAFTGLANDASALYYNPGGLVWQEGATVTGGLILNAYDRLRIGGAIQTGFGTFDLADRSKPSFPAFAASTLHLGRRDAQGQRPFVVAISSFRLRASNWDAFVEMPDPATGVTNTYSQSTQDRDTYYGITLGGRFGERWAGGVSLFLSDASSRYQQLTTWITGADPFAYDASTLSQVAYRLNIQSYYGVMRLGGLYRVADRFQIGFMVQPPGVRLKSRASFRGQLERYDLSAAPPTGEYLYSSQGAKASTPVPAELRVGTAIHVGSKVVLTQDVSLDFPTPDHLVTHLAPVSPDAPASLLFSASTARNFVVNAAVGLQYAPVSYLMLQVGAFTDFSSAPRIPATSNTFTPQRMQRVGFSGAVVLHNQRRGLAVGLIGIMARGHAQGVDLTANVAAGDPLYQRRAATGRTIYLSITGATQVIEELSTVAVERVRPGSTGEGQAPVMPWRSGHAAEPDAASSGGSAGPSGPGPHEGGPGPSSDSPAERRTPEGGDDAPSDSPAQGSPAGEAPGPR